MMNKPISQSVLDASGVVGTWVHDHWGDCLSLTGGFATLLGLDPVKAERGISMATFLDRTHPEDRARMESYLYAVGAMGGPVEAEFRTRESPTGVRTILLRGRIEHDSIGAVAQGCGIAIDRTEERAFGLARAEQIMNRMAEHVIALRNLAQTLRRPILLERIDYLMAAVGCELARYVPEPKDEPLH